MKPINTEHIDLMRGGKSVTNLFSAFGGGIKETRLTAIIGYLISIAPDQFSRILKIEMPQSVALESYHGMQNESRSDILIATRSGDIIIEAKVGHTDPSEQSRRYPGAHRILLTGFLPSTAEKNAKGFTYFTWEEFAERLQPILISKNKEAKHIATELVKYLEGNGMIRKKDTTEVYSREINDESSLNFFLKAHIYGCGYKRSNRMSEARYFAPHFGQSIARLMPGISAGISYIAFIDHVEVSESWEEFIEHVKQHRGVPWLKKHKAHLDAIKNEDKWKWGKVRKKRSFLFLSEPHLVFNPAIHKENLQKGKGFLSKQSYSFDDLFKARSERIW